MENMTTREKIDHIWYYYKFHIIGGILGLLFIINIISGIVNNKDAILNVTILGKSINPQKQEMLQKEMISKFVDNPKKNTAEAIFINFDPNANDQIYIAGYQKFQAMLAAHQIDVLILDKQTFEQLGKMDAFLNLDSLKELDTIKTNLKTVNLNTKNDTGIYGISADNLSRLNDLEFDSQDKVICIPANTKHIEKAVQFLKWFLNM